MKKLERLTLLLVVGAVCPMIGLLTGWWLFFGRLPDATILYAVVPGFALGLLLDVLFLKKWMAAAYQTGLWVWVLIYLFYAVGIFGVLMGVPVINLLLGLPAGILFAGRLICRHADKNEADQEAKKVAWFTTLVLLIACIASAVLALNDPFTAGNLEGMLALPFKVTTTMIWGLILTGGSAILGIQWWLTHITIQQSYRLLLKNR